MNELIAHRAYHCYINSRSGPLVLRRMRNTTLIIMVGIDIKNACTSKVVSQS